MMDTIEHQQTKITSNIEGDAGDTGITATVASEEDDFEEYLEGEETSSERSQYSNIVENGKPNIAKQAEATHETCSNPEHTTVDVKENGTDLCVDSLKDDSSVTEEKTTLTKEADTADFIKVESQPEPMVQEPKIQEEQTIIKIEHGDPAGEESDLPHGNKLNTNVDEKVTTTDVQNESTAFSIKSIKIESLSDSEDAAGAVSPSTGESKANEVSERSDGSELARTSDEEMPNESHDNFLEVQTRDAIEERPQAEPSMLKIKINGAHDPVLQTSERGGAMQEAVTTTILESEKLAVIANNISTPLTPQQELLDVPKVADKSVEDELANNDDNSSSCSVLSTEAEEPSSLTGGNANVTNLNNVDDIDADMVSESGSDSSASQQLVIDHPPESEQNAKVLPIKLSLKRRRSGSPSTDEVNAKQLCQELPQVETTTTMIQLGSDTEQSLLLQRLQQPLPPTLTESEESNLLTCFKCNAQTFENFQQLNEHLTSCNVWPANTATTSTSKAVANESQVAETPMKAPAVLPPLLLAATPIPSAAVQKETYFRCAQCQTVHQSWNFFIHMREVHQRYICLYCLHVYASVEKLSLHLENKHDMDQLHIGNDTWVTLLQQEDRVRHLICCTCQGRFEGGTQVEDHDCAELMQPCTLCGQKGCHTNECRNNSKKVGKRKRKIKRQKAKDDMINAGALETVVDQNRLEEPIVAPANSPSPIPKLVVPKIMLRVPKEFQKSVDAALSSTDTEEEDDVVDAAAQIDVEQPAALSFEAQSLLSEDTETATETASVFQCSTSPTLAGLEADDSSTAKLTRVLAEIERTKLDIQRTKADIAAKKPKVTSPVEVNEADSPPAKSRWSPTPPASPQITAESLSNQSAAEILTPSQDQPPTQQDTSKSPQQRRDTLGSDYMDIDESISEMTAAPEPETEHTNNAIDFNNPFVEAQPKPKSPSPMLEVATVLRTPSPPADGIEVAGADTLTVDLQLDRPLDRFEMVDFIRLCLKAVYPMCLYCNHARRIAVNGRQLVLHMIAVHRFTATVDSITAEELHAETIVSKMKSFLDILEQEYLNSASYCSVDDKRYVQPFNERIYECFQCRYVASTHKELYTHNRRLHIKTNITCLMCRINFYSYSEILCHMCPGNPNVACLYDVKFRCCLCETGELPSAFRLMVHLRKQHNACDICLEDCHSQGKLSSHVWKHKLQHLCYRCGIAYRNKQDISKHLFWKHGTESSTCRRCVQKRWSHVYHFCVPAAQFTCEHCQITFSKAIYLDVHSRMHNGDFRYACTEENCAEKFVSRRLLLKHTITHEPAKEPVTEEKPAVSQLAGEEQEQSKEKSNDNELLPAADDKKAVESQAVLTIKTEPDDDAEEKLTIASKLECDTPAAESSKSKQAVVSPRKRRKKSKRTKESLEDLNLIAPNLSESDSSDETDSDTPRNTGMESILPLRAAVDDLNMPKVMLSPASESDNEEQKEEQLNAKAGDKADRSLVKDEAGKFQPGRLEDNDEEHKYDNREVGDIVPDIWKTLLQNQGAGTSLDESFNSRPSGNCNNVEGEPYPRPKQLHVVFSDHAYCKMTRTPPPTPVKVKTPKSTKRSRHNSSRRAASDDSDSDSSSSSSSSNSSSCSCGPNCSCSSSSSGGASSSSETSSDDSDSSGNEPQTKRSRKKSVRNKRRAESIDKAGKEESLQQQQTLLPQPVEEDINVTAVTEEGPPSPPKPPPYNESDFDTAISDTDEEFYDAHPQRMASELLAQKRAALMADQPQSYNQSNYAIVENSRPSTPSLPEEMAAFAEKRERFKVKKKKRDRKSTCKSIHSTPTAQQQELTASLLPIDNQPMPEALPGPVLQPHQMPASLYTSESDRLLHALQTSHMPLTPLTHRLQPSMTRISEGSSCSDADGTLKRSKRMRRPNKFYGYTSDDENMSSVLVPPLQVGMQLIKPQPPPQLTWAKEDLPTPSKSLLNQSRSKSHRTPKTPLSSGIGSDASGGYLHSNGTPNSGTGGVIGDHAAGSATSSRKRNKRTLLSGGDSSAASSSRKRPTKRAKHSEQLPPIPTLKIRPALLAAASIGGSYSSDSSSADEDAEVNVTSLAPTPLVPSGVPTPQQLQLNSLLPPPVPAIVLPPAPATTAFNQPIPPALLPNPDFTTLQYFKANNIRYPIRPPAGARLAREGESVYCYCRCPYDEVSEMIACDGDNCLIEWFHFECVGIMVAPQGKWFCAECRPKYSEGLYPTKA